MYIYTYILYLTQVPYDIYALFIHCQDEKKKSSSWSWVRVRVGEPVTSPSIRMSFSVSESNSGQQAPDYRTTASSGVAQEKRALETEQLAIPKTSLFWVLVRLGAHAREPQSWDRGRLGDTARPRQLGQQWAEPNPLTGLLGEEAKRRGAAISAGSADSV